MSSDNLSNYSEIVNIKIKEFLTEIGNDSEFKPFLNHPSVKVEISKRYPFCFRASAPFPGTSIEAVFRLLSRPERRVEWDDFCDSLHVLKRIDPLTFIYHLKLKSNWLTTPRDTLSLAAFRKLSEGRFVSVSWSIVDDTLCPPYPSGSYIRMHTRISANLLTPNTLGGFTLTQLIDGDPKGSIPAYIVKKVSAKSLPATVEGIKRVASTL